MCASVYSDNYIGTLNLKNFLVTLQGFGDYGITHERDSTYFIVPHLLSLLILLLLLLLDQPNYYKNH